MPKHFTYKPVDLEAMPFTGGEQHVEVQAWLTEHGVPSVYREEKAYRKYKSPVTGNTSLHRLRPSIREHILVAPDQSHPFELLVTEWLVLGEGGRFYRLSDEYFRKTYRETNHRGEFYPPYDH